MICLSFDTDFVTEEVLKDTINILLKNNIKATVLATGYYDCLQQADGDLIEVGLHPVVQELSSPEKSLKELKKIYPSSVSLRNHSLVHSSRFWTIYQKYNIKYTSNYFMPEVPYISPVILFDTVVELPIFFMDDYYIIKSEKTFSIKDLNIKRPGLKVFCFHPIHLFLNSASIDNYNRAKEHLGETEILERYRNKRVGIRKLFDELIEYLAVEPSFRLSEIEKNFDIRFK